MIIEFLRGTGTDLKGRSIEDMLAMEDWELEKSHDVIQWLFPLPEASAHNKLAPILDQDTIKAILANPVAIANLKRATVRFIAFLEQDGSAKPSWIRPNNHNFLRITRAIKCLKIFQLPEEKELTKLAMDYYHRFPEAIGSKTLKFWQNASKINQ